MGGCGGEREGEGEEEGREYGGPGHGANVLEGKCQPHHITPDVWAGRVLFGPSRSGPLASHLERDDADGDGHGEEGKIGAQI